jgi:nicotinate-nucleotide adenylyltransferase
MKTLCLGGSFNPIHHGHLICARAVMEHAGYERVMLIPSAQPPHKSAHANLAPAPERLRMCQLVVQSSATFVVDEIELKRTGPSYTIDTARELKASRGWSEVHWLIGADMLNYLPQWHRADELLREVHFVVMARPGFDFDWQGLPAGFQHLRERVVEAPRIDISSTQIRDRVRAGMSIDFLTPAPVVDHIQERHLYE